MTFNTNEFKQKIKKWIKDNPNATLAELTEYCEDQIPTNFYTTHKWLIDQTSNWYQHILYHRQKTAANLSEEDGEFVA